MTYRPDLYDVVTPATFHGDVDWYRHKAQECGGPVLELGAGTGRVTLAIAEAGIPIHALDASQAMLDALEAKLATRPREVRALVTPIVADMRTFDLPERFALVIAPFRAFLHNVTEEDRLACLRRVRQHLRPAGRVAFNVFHPSLDYMAQHAGPLAGVWRWVGSYPLPEGGCVVRSEANVYDTVRQIVHSQHRYEEYAADGVLTRTWLHRLDLGYLYPADIRRVLAEAGFQGITISGGFTGHEFSRDADELVVEASLQGASSSPAAETLDHRATRSKEEGMRGDRIGGPIRWRIHIPAPPERVFAALDSDHGRASFWAESAVDVDGHIEFRFINGYACRGKVLERRPPNVLSIDYIGGPARFELTADGVGGTDLLLTHEGVGPEEWNEVHAGWLNVLFPLKAWVIHGVDLRNHDPERSWDQGYADQ